MSKQLTAQELIDANNESVGLLTRAILMGIVEPDVEINADVQLGVAHAMATELFNLQSDADGADFRFVSRIERGLLWAARDDVDPAFGIVFGEQALSLANPDQLAAIKETDGYAAYTARLGATIDAIRLDGVMMNFKADLLG